MMASLTHLLCLIILMHFIAAVDSSCSARSPALDLENGGFRVDLRRTYGKYSVVVAWCSKGYILKGDKIMICNGKAWTIRAGKKPPRCQEPKCPQPPTLVNGFFYYRKGVVPRRGGTKVFFKCLDGFKMDRKVAYLFCLKKNKRWKGQLPKCTAKAKCPNPGVVSYGQHTQGNLEEGSEISFECEEGATLIGSSVIKCLATGAWNHEIPQCKPKLSCNVPTQKDIPHSLILIDNIGDKYVLPGEFLYLECKKGFKVKGINFLECLEDGNWDSDFAECEAVDKCNAITPIENGGVVDNVQLNETKKFGTTLNFYCNDNYRVVGSSWIECVYDEFKGVAWSGDPPKCERITCADHDPPENGLKFPNGPFYVDAVVMYSCSKGYTLIGSRNRTCKENGMWSGVLTTCDSLSTVCPNPGVPINGIKSGSRYNTGNVVVFSCKHRYYLIGNATRVCQSNGYWTGREVSCRGPNEYDDITRTSTKILTKIDSLKLITEKAAGLSNNLNGTEKNESDHSRTLDINNPGGLNLVFLFDSSGSVGQQGFDIAKKFAITLVQHIGVSAIGVRVAAITFSSDVTVNFYTREFLTTEEVIDQIRLIKYKPGDTATNPALMKARTEVIPDATRARPTSKTAIFLITDGRANIRGRPQEQANLIVQEFDVEIYAIGVGSNILEDELASIAYPKSDDDQHYMKVESFAKMNEMLQYLINGTIDYSACGLLQRRKDLKKQEPNRVKVKAEAGSRKKRSYRMRIVGGEEVTSYWPWMAALFYGTPQIGFKRLQCGGSLINKNWILTAAHCLKFRSNTATITYTINNVRVHLGITNFKDPDASNLIVAFPDRLILHPDYDIKTLNNDIALIHLRDPVRYNALIRPVCLPPAIDKIPKDSLFYRAGETAIVTGWGHTKERQKLEPIGFADLKQSAVLKKLSIPIQTDLKCNNSIKGEVLTAYYTDSMVCAGTGKGGEDACSTDSGGPLHQRLEDPEGDGTYYTQIGLVSWGLGCALEGEYGFYTKLAKFIPWVQSQTGSSFS